MVLHCPNCPFTFQPTPLGRDLLRAHLDHNHPQCNLAAINDITPEGWSNIGRCGECQGHFSLRAASCANHAKRCIQGEISDARRATLRYRDFFPNGVFIDAFADALVDEPAFVDLDIQNPQVVPLGDLGDIGAVPAPPAEPNAPIDAANPAVVAAIANAPVNAANPAPNAANAPPGIRRRRGRGAPRQRAAAAVAVVQGANAGNQVPNAAALAQAAHGFNFTFVGVPSAAQLSELDDLASDLSDACYWLHTSQVRILRPLVDKLFLIHLVPEGDACLKKLAIYALLILPGLLMRLQRMKSDKLGDMMHEWSRSASPVTAILQRARQTLILFPRRPSRDTMPKINEAKAKNLVKEQRLGSLLNALQASESGLQPTTKTLAEMTVLATTYHPAGDDNDMIDNIELPQGTAAASVDVRELAIAITKLPKGSAPGASGWTFHLLTLLYADEARRIKGGGEPPGVDAGVGLLHRFLSTITSGTMDDFALRKINTSRLIFVPKETGGERPIAIGDSLLRLLLRTLNAKYAPILQTSLEPLQVAVGTRGGCEVMAALAQDSFNRRDFTLTLDLKSAFNQVWRRAIADGLVRFAPGLLPIFKLLYGRPSELRSNAKEGRAMLVGQSMRGCKQGDPLSMLYFAVAIHDSLVLVNELVLARHADAAAATAAAPAAAPAPAAPAPAALAPAADADADADAPADAPADDADAPAAPAAQAAQAAPAAPAADAHAPATTPFTIAYADDIALGGDPAILCACLPAIIVILGNRTGLEVVPVKCKLFGSEPYILPAGLPDRVLSNAGTLLVGVPIGTQAYQQATCKTLLETASLGAATVSKSRVVPDQVKYALLAKCVNARPQYLARNVFPAVIAPHLRRFDEAIDRALNLILGAPLDPHRAILRSLPLSQSGCGLRRHEGAESIHAFNSRISLVKEFLQKFNQASPAMLRTNNALRALGTIPFTQLDATNTHPVTSLKDVHSNLFSRVLANVVGEQDGQSKSAWLKSGQHISSADSPYSASGKFLLWSGGQDHRWHMENDIFVSALRRRLALPDTNSHIYCMHPDSHDPPGSNVNLALNYGHVLLCRGRNDGTPAAITHRHHRIRDALFELIKKCFFGDVPTVPAEALNRESPVGNRPNHTVIQADIVHVENHNQANAIKVVFDVTIVEPNSRHGIHRTEAGAAVEAAARAKIAEYDPVTRNQPTVRFVPFALDSNGHIGKHATAYLKRLSELNPSAGSEIQHFLQHVSYHLTRQTAIAAEAQRSAAYRAAWNLLP